eukprot:4796824-Pleurochrysis_carterae.AAC.1
MCRPEEAHTKKPSSQSATLPAQADPHKVELHTPPCFLGFRAAKLPQILPIISCDATFPSPPPSPPPLPTPPRHPHPPSSPPKLKSLTARTYWSPPSACPPPPAPLPLSPALNAKTGREHNGKIISTNIERNNSADQRKKNADSKANGQVHPDANVAIASTFGSGGTATTVTTDAFAWLSSPKPAVQLVARNASGDSVLGAVNGLKASLASGTGGDGGTVNTGSVDMSSSLESVGAGDGAGVDVAEGVGIGVGLEEGAGTGARVGVGTSLGAGLHRGDGASRDVGFGVGVGAPAAASAESDEVAVWLVLAAVATGVPLGAIMIVVLGYCCVMRAKRNGDDLCWRMRAKWDAQARVSPAVSRACM